ncbi:capsule-associated protein CAP1 [Beauveria bassiana ARSEF 2860]|uniref:Capsule-associated protein CAP1 n=1 Tax=Beauveria bassiana (strain ARSEF 2860) TaxID=655819 RepID=J5K0A5_BEAB2|nr:capsule-associated protein CAP1 [Beauveria bassiana ARSEF 2860]EJP69983.1 capsule-associated protein CAP1 [Beauveria bassiana ARSEF 2860]
MTPPLSPKSQDRMAALAAATLFCELLTQRLLTRSTELPSEALAWVLLPLLVRAGGRQRRGGEGEEIAPPSSSTAKESGAVLFAAGIAAASFCRAENGTARFHPALVPILLAAQRYMQGDAADATWDHSGSASLIFTSLGAACVIAAVAVLDLFIWDLRKCIYASVALMAVAVAYMTLLPRRRRKAVIVPPVSIEQDIEQLSKWVVFGVAFAFIIQTLVFGLTTGSLSRTVAAAVFKCLTWFFAIHLVSLSPLIADMNCDLTDGANQTRDVSWAVLPSMGVFTLMAGESPFFQSSAFRPLLHIAVSGFSLGQVIYTLPSRSKSRSTLWVFMLVTLIPYGANMVAIRRAESAVQHTFGANREHPVDILMRGANAQFSGLLHRQSKSFEEAQAEYRRRYAIDPPPGFEGWYRFAVAHKSPIIDEFDMIHKQVAPFLKLSGVELQRIMDAAFYADGSELWSCEYNRKEARARCNHPHRSYDRHISSLFETVGKFAGAELPDVRFLVNHLDEPTVVLPSDKTIEVRVTNLSRQPTWTNITRECVAHRADNSHAKDERESYALPFIKDAASAMDICRHPEYEHLHGLFISPVSFRLTEGMVPVLSTGAPSTMGDILMPSPAYMETEFVYDSDQEPSFDKKTNNLYWAGSTTGAFAHDDGWRAYHRQRFVRFAQNLGREQYYYLREENDSVERVASSFLNGRLYNVAFTRIFQCAAWACRAQRAFFPGGAWADKDAALRSRLAFDLDGNGISGRYYKLLASGSLPLKQTLLREWHDERLVPWVHYAPVSQSLEELPELVAYLTSTASGRERAKEMAVKGREWYSKAMRREDMAIYVYRLMLELARLQDPNRQPRA